jgi:hypothetical protein
MRAGVRTSGPDGRRLSAYFNSFNQERATDFAELAKTQLAVPVLSIGGEKALGAALGAQAKLIAPDVTVIVLKGTGPGSWKSARRRRLPRWSTSFSAGHYSSVNNGTADRSQSMNASLNPRTFPERSTEAGNR